MKTLNVKKVSVWTGHAKKSVQDFLTVSPVRLPFLKDFSCNMELKKACGYTVDRWLSYKSGDQAHRALQRKAEPHFALVTFLSVTHQAPLSRRAF